MVTRTNFMTLGEMKNSHVASWLLAATKIAFRNKISNILVLVKIFLLTEIEDQQTFVREYKDWYYRHLQ